MREIDLQSVRQDFGVEDDDMFIQGIVTWEAIRLAQHKDPVIVAWINAIEGEEVDPVDPQEWGPEEKAMAKAHMQFDVSKTSASGEIPAGILFYKHRVVVPRAVRQSLTSRYHGVAHKGIVKTYQEMAELYYWPSMLSAVTEFVNNCPGCLLQRRVSLKDLKHHPLEAVHAPREVAYVDLIGPIQNSGSKYRFIVTAVDGFSRYLATRPIMDKKAQTVAGALHSMFTAELGFPARVIADRGSEFVAADTRLAMETLGVRLQFIPQENIKRTWWNEFTIPSGSPSGRSGSMEISGGGR